MDQHQVKTAIFYFLRCQLNEMNKKSLKSFRKTFFQVLQNINVLTTDQKITTSASQHRFFLEINNYYEEAVEEKPVEIETLGKTISRPVDIFIPKMSGSAIMPRQKAKKIEFDGWPHLQWDFEDPVKICSNPQTVLRDVLQGLYDPCTSITISGIDPLMPDLYAPENLQTRIAWFRFLMIKISTPVILFFINLPESYQRQESWRPLGNNVILLDAQKENLLNAFFSYQELYKINRQSFLKLINQRSEEYKFNLSTMVHK